MDLLTVIPILSSTLDMCEELNNGVRPELEENQTWFVYKGKDEVPEILDSEGVSKTFKDKQEVKVIVRHYLK